MKFSKHSLALAIMAASVSVAHAQAETSSDDHSGKQHYQPTLLNQVTVSATRTERDLDDVASSVSVKTAEDAERSMARTTRDLVRYEPGVEVSKQSRFGLGGFNIRGMDENRVKITVDGVDQARTFGYMRSLRSQRNFFDIENMKRLEVVKGPASSVHGSDAIGGVAAFVTKDPVDYLKAEGDDTHASVKAGYNSSDSSSQKSMTLANRHGDLETLLIYNRRDGKEMKSYGGADVKGEGREQADPQKNKSESLLAKAQYQINDDHRVGVTGEMLDSRSKTQMLSVDGQFVKAGPFSKRFTDLKADDKRPSE